MKGKFKSLAIPDNIRPTPNDWQSTELEGMLISASEIQSRVKDLSILIENELPQNRPIVILPLLSGAFLFAADLIRHWKFSFELDFMGLSSYRNSTRSGRLEWTQKIKTKITGKHVVIIDDILDTGKTLHEAKKELLKQNPTAIHTCVLLKKKLKNSSSTQHQADFSGFTIPDHFVVGYGLDFGLKFRQLPFVGVLSPKCYGTAKV